jgi:lactosylceramide 4-alpha-galactosyltransferase
MMVTFRSQNRSLPEACQLLKSRNTSRAAFFFIETSCSGKVNLRQACSVESAARLHPESDVHLLLLSPPTDTRVDQSTALKRLTDNYPNVVVAYFNLQDYFKDSPLEEWFKSGVLKTSQYPVSHTSDVLR